MALGSENALAIDLLRSEIELSGTKGCENASLGPLALSKLNLAIDAQAYWLLPTWVSYLTPLLRFPLRSALNTIELQTDSKIGLHRDSWRSVL